MKRGMAGYGFDARWGRLAYISTETLKMQGIDSGEWGSGIICGGSTHSHWRHLGHGFYWCDEGYHG